MAISSVLRKLRIDSTISCTCSFETTNEDNATKKFDSNGGPRNDTGAPIGSQNSRLTEIFTVTSGLELVCLDTLPSIDL